MRMLATSFILLSLAASAPAYSGVTCTGDTWDQVICSDDGAPKNIRIRGNIWDEKEVLKDGKVVARCKENIWGETVCN